MQAILIICFIMLLVSAILALYRVISGPTLLDRIIGFDMIAICIIGKIIIMSIKWQTPIFVEIMLIFSLIGFVGTISFICYLHKNPDRIWLRGETTPLKKENRHDS